MASVARRNVLAEILKDDPPEVDHEEGLDLLISMAQVSDLANDSHNMVRLKNAFFGVTNLLIKADGVVTPAEEAALRKLAAQLDLPRPSPKDAREKGVSGDDSEGKTPDRAPAIGMDSALEKLHELIGLGSVKREVDRLVNYLKVASMRKEQGLKTTELVLHMVFTGNPGTGKTTVARLVAQIMRGLGIISSGHLVEVAGSDLMGEYLGQTAPKVKSKVQEALGGVLFIDEAYTLSPEDERFGGYGKEAIDTLLKLMEDNRSELVVIVAGYPAEMNRFVSSNPGLQSRFTRTIHFEDYTPTELLEILQLMCNEGEYVLAPAAREAAEELFVHAYEQRSDSFGNGRLARNVFQEAVANLHDRVAGLGHINREILCTVEPADLPAAENR